MFGPITSNALMNGIISPLKAERKLIPVTRDISDHYTFKIIKMPYPIRI